MYYASTAGGGAMGLIFREKDTKTLATQTVSMKPANGKDVPTIKKTGTVSR